MGLSLIMQFACSDDDKSGGNYNGPLKLTTFYPDSGYLSSKIIIEGENLGTDASKLSVVKQVVDIILAEILPVQPLKLGD